MKKLIFLSMLFLTAACVGTSPSSQFYTMRSNQNAEIISKSVSDTIGIEQVKIPYMLDRPQMVVMNKNKIEVSISERHRWAEPLSLIIQKKLIDDISAVLPNAQIGKKNYALEKFNRSVNVEISTLQATLGDKITLEAWYTLDNASGKTLLKKKYTSTKPVGDTYDDLVSVESDMIQNLAEEIAQAIAKYK